MQYRERYQEWLDSDRVDDRTKEELRSLAGNEQEIRERFSQDLEFGTAGLRGIIAAGTNRMNVYTVRHATQGLINYLLKKDPATAEKGIAIAYDSRHMSAEFAAETAAVANGNGVRAYVFKSLRPTPELSFAIRTLGCKGGVVITASHNPAQYNGYKAYWEDGCQIPPPMDEEVIEEVQKVDLFDGIRVMERQQAEKAGLYVPLGEAMDRQYIDTIKNLIIDREELKRCAADLKIVYSPLHGTGRMPVMRALTEAGFSSVELVPSQAEPDGDFPTAPYPNPEDPKVFGPAKELGEKCGADILIATDPDADRMGLMVKTEQGYQILNGNMVGVLLSAYLMESRSRSGKLPADSFIVSSIVSTTMCDAIAADYGVEVRRVLTGFKYIGQQILQSEQTGRGTFIMGFEESYGYLCGTYARDKDAVGSVLVAAEMAAVYKSRGLTLLDVLQQLYRRYGYYQEKVTSLTFEGLEGAQKIREMMKGFRENPKAAYGGLKVLEVRDYAAGLEGLPPSNVLRFTLEGNCWFCIRPSGTEPKIKFYFGVRGSSEDEARQVLEKLQGDVLS